MVADEIITIYNDERILVEVQVGEHYYVGNGCSVFQGTAEECKNTYPNLKLEDYVL